MKLKRPNWHNKFKIDGQINKSQGSKLVKDNGTGLPLFELDSTCGVRCKLIKVGLIHPVRLLAC